jgi:glutathione S-transferase
MSTLYHSPLCPLSRFIRLVLSEWGFEHEAIEERVWERRHDFLVLNPAGTVPVLVEDGLAVPGAETIVAYIEETRGQAIDSPGLMPEGAARRVEVRRLTDWFNHKFHEEVSGPLAHEKVMKRFMGREQGGGSPDMISMRTARANIRYHLHYIGWLIGRRHWLAGDRISYADLAAAAHLSVCDYLGDVPWDEDEAAKLWYARIKSRPSFRLLLGERLRGVTPPLHYADLDF